MHVNEGCHNWEARDNEADSEVLFFRWILLILKHIETCKHHLNSLHNKNVLHCIFILKEGEYQSTKDRDGHHNL